MYYIGFDIGGTKCAVSLGKWERQNIEILKREEILTMNSPFDTFDFFAPFLEQWLKE